MSTAKESPILFTGPMVRAILEERKTVTRRVLKPQYESLDFTIRPATNPRHERHSHDWWLPTGTQPYTALPNCPYGKPGDRLWVREAWVADAQLNAVAPRELSQGEPIQYPADGAVRQTGCSMITPGKTRPSIHMPRWASRLLLEIADVRVERLRAGEGETAFESRYIAEGINRIHHGDGEYAYHAFNTEPKPGNWSWPEDAFKELWNSLNGTGAWNANPWVWVVEFKRLKNQAIAEAS